MERSSERWAAERKCAYWILFVSTALLTFAGFAIFIIFAIRFKNNHAAMWSLSAGVFSAASFHLHVLNLVSRLSEWHDRKSLNQIKYLAWVVCALSTVGGGVYGALAYKTQQEIDFGENNFILSSISAALSLSSGLLLLLTAKFYRSQLAERGHVRLENEEGSSFYH